MKGKHLIKGKVQYCTRSIVFPCHMCPQAKDCKEIVEIHKEE